MLPQWSLPLAPPICAGPPDAQVMLAAQAAPSPQRQTAAAALVSHHSPAAQQTLPQQTPDVQVVQFAAHE